MPMLSEDRGGRLQTIERRPNRFMARLVLGGVGAGSILVEYAAIRFVFTEGAVANERHLIDAKWARPTIIQSPRIYARTNDLVVATRYKTIVDAVRDLATILPFKRAASGVGVHLNAVDVIDVEGRFGRLGFVVRDAHGQHVDTEWVRLSRNGRRGIFGGGGFGR